MLASVELLHGLGPSWTTRKRRIIATKQSVHKIVAIYSRLDRVPVALQHKLEAWSCLYRQEISEQRGTACFELSPVLTVRGEKENAVAIQAPAPEQHEEFGKGDVT